MLEARVTTALAIFVAAGPGTVETEGLEAAPGIWCVIAVEKNT